MWKHYKTKKHREDTKNRYQKIVSKPAEYR